MQKIFTSVNKIVKNNPFIILFIVFSFLPLTWLVGNSKFLIAGEGDFISPIIWDIYLQKRLFVFDPIVFGGIDISFYISGLFPLTLFFLLLDFINISFPAATILFISMLLFLAEISMYFFIKDFLTNKIKTTTRFDNLIAGFGAILYAFSPFFASFIEPGHFILLIPYSLFPTIIFLTDKILIEKKIKLSFFIILFWIFFFSATSFGNVAIIYSLLIALGFYFIFLVFIEKLNFFKSLLRFSGVIAVLLLSNLWWLIPFISNIGKAISLNSATNAISQAISLNVKNADIYKLFFSNQAVLGAQPNSYPFSIIFFLFLITFFIIAILKIKKKAIALYVLMIIAGIFITKGGQEPFQIVFQWLYDNVPGFQIFRRPVQKFYWVFYFFFLMLSAGGISFIFKYLKIKKQKILLLILMSGLSIYSIVSFLLIQNFTYFSIPRYYFDAKEVLKKDNVNKVFIAPGFYGDSPYYDKSLNYYHGDDFLKTFWNFQMLIPDSSTGSLETFQKEKVNETMDLIRGNKSFCSSVKEQGISHLMIRQDVFKGANTEDGSEELIKLLDENKMVKNKKYFGKKESGFTIYSIVSDCRSDVLSVGKNIKLSNVYFQNPVRVSANINGIKDVSDIYLNLNFDKNWKLYLQKTNNKNFNLSSRNYISGDVNELYEYELSFMKKDFQISESSHTIGNGYANLWKIDPGTIKENFSKDYYIENKDGSIDINIIAYYSTQMLFYVSLLVQLIVAIIFFVSIFVIQRFEKYNLRK